MKHDKHGRPLPPAETRWKKGVSGNPRGRPKKEDSLTSLLKEEIKKICPADRQKRTYEELLVLATLQLAMKGNAAALKEVWERVDGKIPQTGKVQRGDADGKQVTIKVVYDEDEEINPSTAAQHLGMEYTKNYFGIYDSYYQCPRIVEEIRQRPALRKYPIYNI